MPKKEIKLPKINAETAKLYELAGFGAIANELPFMCRVQYELRLKGVVCYVRPIGESFDYIGCVLPHGYETDYYTDDWEEALEGALQKGLKTLIHENND